MLFRSWPSSRSSAPSRLLRDKIRFFCRAALLIAAALMVPSAAAGASKLILNADADVRVSEGNPQHNANDIHLLQAGVGHGPETGLLVTYLRFDLSDVPMSTVFQRTEITRAELTLFAQSSGLPGEWNQLFVSVAGCSNTDWAEDAMTWESRVCPGLTQADDMQLIGVADLPKIYRWDVTRSVAQALNGKRTRVALIISAFKIEVTPGAREIVPGRQFGPEESVGFVRFWSRSAECVFTQPGSFSDLLVRGSA